MHLENANKMLPMLPILWDTARKLLGRGFKELRNQKGAP